jgi:hypothetical protein
MDEDWGHRIVLGDPLLHRELNHGARAFDPH